MHLEYRKARDLAGGMDEKRAKRRMASRIRSVENQAYRTGALKPVPEEDRPQPTPKREGKRVLTEQQKEKKSNRKALQKLRQRISNAVVLEAIAGAVGCVPWPEGLDTGTTPNPIIDECYIRDGGDAPEVDSPDYCVAGLLMLGNLLTAPFICRPRRLCTVFRNSRVRSLLLELILKIGDMIGKSECLI